MKRSKLIKYLESSGCYFKREGTRHTIYTSGSRSTIVPRHSEIADHIAQKICKDLGIPKISRGK